jgi:hypothetical protein
MLYHEHFAKRRKNGYFLGEYQGSRWHQGCDVLAQRCNWSSSRKVRLRRFASWSGHAGTSPIFASSGTVAEDRIAELCRLRESLIGGPSTGGRKRPIPGRPPATSWWTDGQLEWSRQTRVGRPPKTPCLVFERLYSL